MLAAATKQLVSARQPRDSNDCSGVNSGRSAFLNADRTDDGSAPGLGHERLTGHVRLDELSDQLWIAVVQGVRTGDGDCIDVRQHGQTRSIGDPDERIT